MPDISKIKIFSINVNSIITLDRRLNLMNFIDNNKPDIVLLNETKLNSKHKIYFENYNFIRTDRENARQSGGTAIIIRNDIKFKKIKILGIQKFSCIETTIISLKLQNNKLMYIVAIYGPSTPGNIFITELQKLFDILKLEREENYYIIAGDLNAKHSDWKNRINNSRGNALKNWLRNNEYLYKCKLQSSEHPTFPRSGSYLDLCLADIRLKLTPDTATAFLATIDYDSDHCAIYMEVKWNDTEKFMFEKYEQQYSYNYTNTNWNYFRKNIARNYKTNIPINQAQIVANNINLSNAQIDTGLNKINELIVKTIEKTVPKHTPKNYSKMFTNATIKLLQNHKNRLISNLNLIKRTQRYINTNHVNRLKAIITNTQKLIKENLSIQVNKYWTKKLQSIIPTNKTMFPEINKIFRSKSKIKIPEFKISQDNILLLADTNIYPNTLEVDENSNYIVSLRNEKMEILGKYFESTHKNDEHLGDPNNNLRVKRSIDQFKNELNRRNENKIQLMKFSSTAKANCLNSNDTKNYFITLEDLIQIFQNLNNKKSSGIDEIPNVILKHLPRDIIAEYCTLFNNMLNNYYFPSNWKIAKILPILKPKKGQIQKIIDQ